MGQRSSIGAGEGAGGRVPVYDSYGRLSRVPDTGELEKVVTQFADNRKVIERLGGTVGKELWDGLSAWKRGVRRKDWELLLERARNRVSDGIVIWHTDRLFRLPEDLETLIKLADDGFMVASAHGTRNLSDPDDRFILRIEVAHAARSSDDTQRRIKRKLAAKRRDGQRHATARPFGFPGLEHRPRGTRVALSGSDGVGLGELITREKVERAQVSIRQVARERSAIRSGTRAVLADVPDADIAREWNAKGLRTSAGNEWTGRAVRAVLCRPVNAGLIEDDGVVVGRMPGRPIVPEKQFNTLRSKVAARKKGTGPRAEYLASGIAECGGCGRTMAGRPHVGSYPDGERRRQYGCRKERRGCGKVAVDMCAVDRELRAFTVERLSDPTHAAALSAARARVADRLAEVEAEIRECEELQEALAERLGRRELKKAAFDKANKPLVADLERLAAERDELTGSESSGPVAAMSADEVTAQWKSGTIVERRAMLRQALGHERLRIMPAARKGGGRFDRERIKIIPAAIAAL